MWSAEIKRHLAPLNHTVVPLLLVTLNRGPLPNVVKLLCQATFNRGMWAKFFAIVNLVL